MLAKLHIRIHSLPYTVQLALKAIIITSILVIISPFAWTGVFRKIKSPQTIRIPGDSLAYPANDTVSPDIQREILWQQLLHLFQTHSPGVAQIRPFSPANKTQPHNSFSPNLPDLISLEEKDIKYLQDTHSSYVSKITSHNAPALVYNEDTHGIVTTASGRYLHILLVSVRMLRRTGCLLPVQVFVERIEDFKSSICGLHLPALGASCYLFSNIIGDNIQDYGVTAFQLKIFAILFSTFENVLFLDADNLAVSDPTPLLIEEPLASNGLVLWPDFWVLTASPIYFDVSQQDQLTPTSRPSSESGQLLVSKKRHASTLLLAAYYNFYGPHHYYPLLAQGGPGQGDKETYCAAAVALKLSYYVVHEHVDEVGPKKKDGTIRGIAMAQHNPVADNLRTQKKLTKSPPWIFIHHHNPKLDPMDIFNSDAPTRNDGTGRWQRMWGSAVSKTKFGGVDMEKRLWQELCLVACSIQPDGPGSRARKTCANCKKYTQTMFGREGAF